MQKNNLLEHYEQLNFVVEQMLINARDENWDLLLSWQAQYLQLSKGIMLNNGCTIENMPFQHHDTIKMYIKNIISYQKQLTELIITRHTKLRKWIGEHVDYQTKIDSYQAIANLM